MSRGNQRLKPLKPGPPPEALEPWSPPTPKPVDQPDVPGVPEGSMLALLQRFNAVHRRSQPFGRRRFSDY